MTEATLQALEGLRDLSAIKWYAVTLLPKLSVSNFYTDQSFVFF